MDELLNTKDGTAAVTLTLPALLVRHIQELAAANHLQPHEILTYLINRARKQSPTRLPFRKLCPLCGDLVLIDREQRRAQRRYCSSACRLKAYHGRQNRARQMAHAGRSYREIAKELHSKVATIRYWVTGHRK